MVKTTKNKLTAKIKTTAGEFAITDDAVGLQRQIEAMRDGRLHDFLLVNKLGGDQLFIGVHELISVEFKTNIGEEYKLPEADPLFCPDAPAPSPEPPVNGDKDDEVNLLKSQRSTKTK